VHALLSNSLPRGSHFAAEVLEPTTTIDLIRSSPSLTHFEVVHGALDCPVDEGIL
jgi:hypothetical protein